jgi:hypothetical protein
MYNEARNGRIRLLKSFKNASIALFAQSVFPADSGGCSPL